jgi:hypothetical protein
MIEIKAMDQGYLHTRCLHSGPVDTATWQARANAESIKRKQIGWVPIIAGGILALWVALSPSMVHGDWSGNNFLVISIATLILFVAYPIGPMSAVAAVLGLHTLAILMAGFEEGRQFNWWVVAATVLGRDIVKCCGSVSIAYVPGAHTVHESTMLPSRRAAAVRLES